MSSSMMRSSRPWVTPGMGQGAQVRPWSALQLSVGPASSESTSWFEESWEKRGQWPWSARNIRGPDQVRPWSALSWSSRRRRVPTCWSYSL